MKTLKEYIVEAKTIDYTNEEVEKANTAKTFNLMLATIGDSSHVCIKPVGQKHWSYDLSNEKDFFNEWSVEEFDKNLASKVWVIVASWQAFNSKSRVNNLYKTYTRPILNTYGMFFNSPNEAKMCIKNKKNEIKTSLIHENAKGLKLQAMTVAELQDLYEKQRNERKEFTQFEHLPLGTIEWNE